MKYYLEQQGCSVLASEYNDFPKSLEQHSYEACVEVLDKADYFILFIGFRVGGWYNEQDRISITQQEYRQAYALHLQGKIKLMCFVRTSVWQLKEDRTALSKYLETLDIDLVIKKGIQDYPTKNVNDAAFICDFIHEVTRNEESKIAITSGCPMPTGNWIHQFDNFGDIVDVIQVQIFSGIPIDHVILRRLLLNELKEVLRVSLIKPKSSSCFSPLFCVQKFYEEHSINIESREEICCDVNTKRWDMLSTIAVQLLRMKYYPLILPKALISSAFLRYEAKSGMYHIEPVYEALSQLNEQIRILNEQNTTEVLSVIFSHTKRNRPKDAITISIETIKLLKILYILDRWINIIELSRAIICYLQGDSFDMPSLRPCSPIPEMSEEIQNEYPSLVDVDQFIEEYKSEK